MMKKLILSFVMDYYMGDDEYCYWSPYLQHFLHETKVLDKLIQKL